MPSTDSWTRGSRAGGCLLKVLCWQCVCVLHPLLFLLSIPEHTHAARSRCGAELVADLEFVCGGRGFYRGKPGGPRGVARQRGSGIVEECCVKGCDLQHLESYCARAKRTRRHTADTAQQTMEEMFKALFLKRYEQQATRTRVTDRRAERAHYMQAMRRDLHKSPEKQQPRLLEKLQDDASSQQNASTEIVKNTAQRRWPSLSAQQQPVH
ncbi:hypothetical protein ACEWY4_000549 [Coilia grayii]|uniref:Insulin-like domain-containing protein n=1 Tax=Coilia grayii TaxID=363190 RepID=A0ABD1KXI0_9TELE